MSENQLLIKNRLILYGIFFLGSGVDNKLTIVATLFVREQSCGDDGKTLKAVCTTCLRLGTEGL